MRSTPSMSRSIAGSRNSPSRRGRAESKKETPPPPGGTAVGDSRRPLARTEPEVDLMTDGGPHRRAGASTGTTAAAALFLVPGQTRERRYGHLLTGGEHVQVAGKGCSAMEETSKKQRFVVDIDTVPPLFPTHLHSPEQLGRTVATFGLPFRWRFQRRPSWHA